MRRRAFQARLSAFVAPPDVAICYAFVRPPFGGSNQFLLALRREFRRRGLRVGEMAGGGRTRGAILNAHLVDESELRHTLGARCRVAHRVDGPLQVYRGVDNGDDARITQINREFADVTVFQSEYSRCGYERLGLSLRHPVVIGNAVDPAIFHPPPSRDRSGARKVKIISTSWSDNPNKGTSTYEYLDQALDWSRFEYTFVGRTLASFENIRTVAPLPSKQLAELLRGSDVFIGASRNESCSNALLEALASGLPCIFHASGGSPGLVGEGGLGFLDDREIPDLVDRLVSELDERRDAISIPSISEVADRYLDVLEMTT